MEKCIEEQIKWLEESISREQNVIDRFEKYENSAIKSGVLYQTKGAVRGLKEGVVSLKIVLETIKEKA